MATIRSEERSIGRRNKGKPPLIWFSSPVLPEKTYFGLYRAILTGEELRNPDLVDVLRKKQVAPISMPKPAKDGTLPPLAYKGPHIFLCMIGGGHFAAMVVSLAPRPTKGGTTMNREATVLAHKTFHRYTTRAEAGWLTIGQRQLQGHCAFCRVWHTSVQRNSLGKRRQISASGLEGPTGHLKASLYPRNRNNESADAVWAVRGAGSAT